jgi:hypothetical protein
MSLQLLLRDRRNFPLQEARQLIAIEQHIKQMDPRTISFIGPMAPNVVLLEINQEIAVNVWSFDDERRLG